MQKNEVTTNIEKDFLDVTCPDMIRLVSRIDEANLIAQKFGINISQPGLIKEIVMAQKLGHSVVSAKHLPDACDPKTGDYFEYLSCQNKPGLRDSGKNFAIDCMFSRPETDLERSLKRITRNRTFYCGVFRGTLLEEIYEVPTQTFLDYTTANLNRRDKGGTSKNREHTVNYSLKWVKEVGTKIYEKSID